MTLASRLRAGILLLLAILAATSWLILTQAARGFSDELTQQLNGSIAMYVVDEAPLIRAGQPDAAQLARLARQAMVINPMVDVYLLDPLGRIIGRREVDAPATAPATARGTAPTTLLARSVALAPIRAFLAGARQGPLYGTDPQHPGRPQVFSVAEVRDAGLLQGYVYVVLGGTQAATLRETLGGSYILRAALGTVLVVLWLAALAAWALTAWLTRPIRELGARAQQLGAELGAGAMDGDVQRMDSLEAVRAVFEALAHRLHAQLIELRQSDGMRRELFTNISHDLRTPLTAMRGYLETLALHVDDLAPHRRHEYVAIASRHCDRLNRLVEQIFSLARLDVGAMPLRLEPVSLAELAQDIVRKYQLPAQNAALALRLVLDPTSPPVNGDIAMLETVLENLLDNALRHSAAGSAIVVSVRGGAAGVQVQVSDEGSGIEPCDLQRLSQRFEAGRGGRTGLGLAIASRVLALHGSALELASRPGQGTTAAFRMAALSRESPDATGSRPSRPRPRPAVMNS